MRATEARLQLLVGRVVHDAEGRRIGRLEDVRTETRGDETHAVEFLVDGFGLIERFAGWEIARALFRRLLASRTIRSHRIPWHAIDLADPRGPRLRMRLADLEATSPLATAARNTSAA